MNPIRVAGFTLTFYPVVKGFTLGQIQTWINLSTVRDLELHIEAALSPAEREAITAAARALQVRRCGRWPQRAA